MKASARKSQLDHLESKLRTALGRETKNVIEIGKLLMKSQGLLKHGDWLDWIKDHFDLSQRTAYNYCAAAGYELRKGKFATVANLAPGLLYALAAGNHYNEQEEAAILAATHEGRVDQARADAIRNELASANDDDDNDTDDPGENGAETATAEDAEAILDGPPPDVPPPAPITTPDFALKVFDKAVDALKPLVTKSVAEFTATVHAGDLEEVASFIRAVADRARKAKLP